MDEQYENISPIDGRYRSLTRDVSCFFSEFALISYRIMVEVEYFIKLSLTLGFEVPAHTLRTLYKSVNQADVIRIKAIEDITNHDVKAVEYFLREKCLELGIGHTHFIHFGLTSQDINNTALSLSILDYTRDQFFKHMENIASLIQEKGNLWQHITMLARTHGQPAVPTTLGKEMQVFSYRLAQQYVELRLVKVYSKFGGASGNLNAHYFAYPDIDWCKFGTEFLASFDLKKNLVTTQIDSYDNLSQIFDNVKRLCTILIDFTRDIWHYISIEYLVQSYVSDEVGSSTMPHKINPINFENAEGNLMLAVSLFEFFSRKLPISRLQRDLTDSTVTRNIGVAFGHLAVAHTNIVKGLAKIKPNLEKISQDLDDNVAVLTEGMQTIMRKYGDENAYEKIKLLSRNNERITMAELRHFIQELDAPEAAKKEMIKLNMHNYRGTTA